MLSRRSFAKLCGLSTIPLFTGLEVKAESPKSLVPDYSVARTVTIDSNLLMPDVAQVFTKTTDLEFPLDFIGDGEHSIRLIPYMITTYVDYASKYKGRSDVVNKATEVGIAFLQQKIEMEMLNLLFCAGLETGIRRLWKWEKTKWKTEEAYHKFIMSPETIEDCSSGPNPSKDLLCSYLLGKDQPFQQELLTKYCQKFSGDICLRIDPNSDSVVLTHLESLPSLIGFNTSFDFDAKTLKVTEKPFRKCGRETISLAYFCGMGVLDYTSVSLLDLRNA